MTTEQHPPRRKTILRPKRGLSRLIVWEWAIVLVLLTGLTIAAVAMSHGPDPKRQAAALVEQMKAAVTGRALGDQLFGAYPAVSGSGRDLLVTMTRVPPKVCVLVSWDLYRFGAITVNGVTPQRVSAARLVDLCNAEETAVLIWAPKPLN
jgi:hypothetical protein